MDSDIDAEFNFKVQAGLAESDMVRFSKLASLVAELNGYKLAPCLIWCSLKPRSFFE